MKVKFTEKADKDLINIWRYIADDSESKANEYIYKLTQSAIVTLSEFPFSSPLYNKDKNIRRHVYQNYNLYYQVNESQETVYIVHILHSSLMANTALRQF